LPALAAAAPIEASVASDDQASACVSVGFVDRGVDASLRAIGDAIGVSHTALRYYFASRDELLVEVYRAHGRMEHEPPRPRPVVCVSGWAD
jgi:Bacterial regulatory proteins, tetR family